MKFVEALLVECYCELRNDQMHDLHILQPCKTDNSGPRPLGRFKADMSTAKR